MNVPIATTFIIYMLVILAFGLALSRRLHTYEDFIIGGRTIGPAVSSASLITSFMSGYTYTAAPGLGYAEGYGALWWAFGETPGNALSFGLLGRRLRKASELLRAISMPEFYEKRFDSPALRVITVAVLLVAISMYLVAQWVAAGTLLEVALGIDYVLGLVIGAAVVIAYTIAGGYLAVVFTDAIQGVIMFVGSQILFWAALVQVGGWGALNDTLAEFNPDLVTPWGPDLMYYGFLAALTPVILITLGTFGLPHVTVRHLSLRSPSAARQAMLITGIVVFLFSFLYYMTGPLALAYFGEGLENVEQAGILLWFAVLPAVLAGVMSAAAIAAIMSTADSFLILLTTTIGHDILYRFFMRDSGEMRRLRIARVLVGVLAVITFLVAMNPPGLVFDIVIAAYGGLALSFGVPNLFAVFWRRTTKNAVIASMVLSLAVYVTASWTEFTLYGLNGFMLGLIVALAAIVVVSLIGDPPTPEQLAVFETGAEYGDLPPDVTAHAASAVGEEATAALARLGSGRGGPDRDAGRLRRPAGGLAWRPATG